MKYGQSRPTCLVYENFAYGSDDPAAILAGILSARNEEVCGPREAAMSPLVRVVGCAIEPHRALEYCVVIIFTDVFFEVDSINVQPTVARTKPVQALYTPAKNSSGEFAYVSFRNVHTR